MADGTATARAKMASLERLQRVIGVVLSSEGEIVTAIPLGVIVSPQRYAAVEIRRLVRW
jgi:hypothetical protein